MNRFELFTEEESLFIRHLANPTCVIEVIILEKEALWSEVAGWESIFNFFVFRKSAGNILYMFLVVDGEDIYEEDVQAHKNVLQKAWKWYLHRYLLGEEKPPIEGRKLIHVPDEDELFSFEEVEGKRYVYHRGEPVFRLEIPHDFKGGDLPVDELEFIDSNINLATLPTKMRELGDWLALNL